MAMNVNTPEMINYDGCRRVGRIYRGRARASDLQSLGPWLGVHVFCEMYENMLSERVLGAELRAA